MTDRATITAAREVEKARQARIREYQTIQLAAREIRDAAIDAANAAYAKSTEAAMFRANLAAQVQA